MCSGANDFDRWSFARSGWLESTACAHAQLPGTVTAEGHGARYGLTHQSQREHGQHIYAKRQVAKKGNAS